MKVLTGKVISKKMEKTATVVVERFIAHPIYKKRYKIVKKYHVHDEMGAKVGQKVRFAACKPISKLKKWKIIEVIDKKDNKTKVKKNNKKKGKK